MADEDEVNCTGPSSERSSVKSRKKEQKNVEQILKSMTNMSSEEKLQVKPPQKIGKKCKN